MLVSQHPRDSNAPVRLAQFKHETDYKHCWERWGQIRCFAFTFSYDGRHVDSVEQKPRKASHRFTLVASECFAVTFWFWLNTRLCSI